MSGLTRWEPFRTQLNPWRELEEVQKRLSAIWGGAPVKAGGQKEAISVAEWSPLVDITEDEKEYLIKAELPDIKKDDVKLTVQDNVLAISGDRKYEKEEKDRKYHRVERAYGSFLRSFTLPEDAEGSKVAAEYKDGILKVHLPKSAQVKPKSIEVKVS